MTVLRFDDSVDFLAVVKPGCIKMLSAVDLKYNLALQLTVIVLE